MIFIFEKTFNMNRLVIIGNGFDLAHDLPTSYRSFLNYIWQNVENVDTMPMIKDLFFINNPFHNAATGFKMKFNDYSDFSNKIKSYFHESAHHYIFSELGTFKLYKKKYGYDGTAEQLFGFRNSFFELITVQNAENWVDIENTYYEVLISMLKGETKYSNIGTVHSLNRQFEEIKLLLEFYLTEKIEKEYIFENTYSDSAQIANLFEYKYKNLIKNKDHDYYFEFPADYARDLKEFDHQFRKNAIQPSGYENLFLDFNYTPTVSNYVKILNDKDLREFGDCSQLQIHGRLGDDANSINFGFGDEMDDHYKILEKGGNEYLENIKSFMYLNNSNYKKLLQWIENDDFQVYIMGHSCGLSDRTLLNTVFEHTNCKSIKIFYHQRIDGTDNFKEISQNISRHFNKKALMRSKLVDKSNSTHLPQNIRFKKVAK